MYPAALQRVHPAAPNLLACLFSQTAAVLAKNLTCMLHDLLLRCSLLPDLLLVDCRSQEPADDQGHQLPGALRRVCGVRLR